MSEDLVVVAICPTVHNSHVNVMSMFVLWDKYKVTVMYPQGHSKLEFKKQPGLLLAAIRFKQVGTEATTD